MLHKGDWQDSRPSMDLEARLRKNVPRSQWERAEIWVSEGRVQLLRRNAEEEAWRVMLPGQSHGVEALIWPREKDGSCSCEAESCVHLVAAFLARSQAGTLAPAPSESRIRYTLRRQEGQLCVERQVPNAAVRRTEDAELNRLLVGWWGKPLPRNLAPLVLPQLAGLPVELVGPVLGNGPDHQGAVTVDPRPLLPILRVEDQGNDFRVRLVRAPGIVEVFTCGVVRLGTTLRIIGQPDFEEAFRNQLTVGITYAASETYRLVAETLPALKKKLQVDIVTTRLPTLVEAAPRLDYEVIPDGPRIRITTRLVYGDPPIARLDRGLLRPLGDKLPVRDLDAERLLQEQLERQGGSLALNLPVEREGEAALRLIDSLSGTVRTEVLRKAPHFRKLKEAMEPFLVVEETTGGWKVEVDAGGVDADTLIKAWRDRALFVPLMEGGWRPLPKAWLDRHGAMLEELLSSRESGGRIPRQAAPLLLAAMEAMEQPPPAELASLRAMAGDFQAIPEVRPPVGLVAELRPYQKLGISWMHWLRSVGMGGILADDMGLGKTLQCLAALALTPGRHLVVAPTSVLRNWGLEAKKFLPSMSVNLYYGSKRELDSSSTLTITSYALLRLDLEVLKSVRWTTVVLDEAQAIKNPDAQVAQAAFSLPAEHRLAMTGTPVENRLEELWSAFHFASPGLLGSRSSFRSRFEEPIGFGSRSAQEALRRRIRPFMLRRLKKDVAKDLPERTEMVIRCSLSEEERGIYQSVRTLARADVAKMLEGGRMLSVLEVLLRMRQAACHPGLLSKSWEKGSAKLDLLVETLEEVVAEGHAALVFSQWTSLLDKVEPALEEKGLRFVRLDGSTRDRQAVVDAFSAEDGPPVFLLSLKAGGTGLNLTRADYVFHLDPWWNPAAEDQATDRAHRIGQQRPVVSYKLIAEDTVEERILELQARKRDLMKAAIDDEALARSLGREELLALFE